jgi:hypothetical protein
MQTQSASFLAGCDLNGGCAVLREASSGVKHHYPSKREAPCAAFCEYPANDPRKFYTHNRLHSRMCLISLARIWYFTCHLLKNREPGDHA